MCEYYNLHDIYVWTEESRKLVAGQTSAQRLQQKRGPSFWPILNVDHWVFFVYKQLPESWPFAAFPTSIKEDLTPTKAISTEIFLGVAIAWLDQLPLRSYSPSVSFFCSYSSSLDAAGRASLRANHLAGTGRSVSIPTRIPKQLNMVSMKPLSTAIQSSSTPKQRRVSPHLRAAPYVWSIIRIPTRSGFYPIVLISSMSIASIPGWWCIQHVRYVGTHHFRSAPLQLLYYQVDALATSCRRDD